MQLQRLAKSSLFSTAAGAATDLQQDDVWARQRDQQHPQHGQQLEQGLGSQLQHAR